MGRQGLMIGLVTLALAVVACSALSFIGETPLYKRTRLALFKGLVADPSPRRQILVAQQIWSDAIPSPKPVDVVARAVAQAPDDAFVQWYAAYNGRFSAYATRPDVQDTAIANLIRLEPDNAVGWTFAVAVAASGSDEDAVDNALSHLAAAKRADDHAMEAFTEWGKAFASGLKEESQWVAIDIPPPDIAAFAPALRYATSGLYAVAIEIKDVCNTATDVRSTRRRGWCAKGAHLLASKGNSLELRRLGLDILAAIGDRSTAVQALERQYIWYATHDAEPREFDDTYVASMRRKRAAWEGADSHIAAIERELAALGKPLQVPHGWIPPPDPDDRPGFPNLPDDQHPWRKHLVAVTARLRTSSDPVDLAIAWSLADWNARPSKSSPAAAPSQTIAPLASAHPDDIHVQWIATRDSATRDTALAHLQRLEPANIAVWLVALPRGDEDPPRTTRLLASAAKGTHYSDPGVAMLRVLAAAADATPPAPGSVDLMRRIMPRLSADGFGRTFTAVYANALKWGDQAFSAACRPDAPEIEARRGDCIVIARKLLRTGNTAGSVESGDYVLGQLGAMTPADLAKARERTWWLYVSAQNQPATPAKRIPDVVETDDEIDAARRVAERRGRPVPPPEWRTPSENYRDERAPHGDASLRH